MSTNPHAEACRLLRQALFQISGSSARLMLAKISLDPRFYRTRPVVTVKPLRLLETLPEKQIRWRMSLLGRKD